MNILGREGEDRRKAVRFYVAVMKVFICFELEMWVVTPRLEKAPVGFHHRSVRQMAGMGPKNQQEGT